MSHEKRQRLAAAFTALIMSPQMRDDTLEAMAGLVDDGYGTLVLAVPRSKSKPIDGAVIQGGLAARFVETRDLL